MFCVKATSWEYSVRRGFEFELLVLYSLASVRGEEKVNIDHTHEVGFAEHGANVTTHRTDRVNTDSVQGEEWVKH